MNHVIVTGSEVSAFSTKPLPVTAIPFRLLTIAALGLFATACATAPAAPAATPAPAADEDQIHTRAAGAQETVTEPAMPLDSEAPPAAAANAPAPVAQDKPPQRALSPAQRSTAQMHIMTGELAAGRKQPGLAAREFVAALEIVDDADLAQRATSLALAARNEELAMKAARRWQALEPNEVDPREVITRLALNKGDFDEAYEQCAVIVGGAAGGADDGFRQVAQILSMAGKEHGADAIKLMQRLTSKWQQLPEAQQSLAMLALRYEDLPLADFAARQALKLDPSSRDAKLLLAGIRVRQHQYDESAEIIDQLAKSNKDASELRLGYAKLLLETGERERARAQLETLIKADPKNADGNFALGVLDANDRNFDEAAKRFEPLLAGARAPEAAFQLGRIEEQRKNYDKALSYYEMVTTLPQALDAAVRRAAVLSQLGRMKDARTVMVALRERFPQFEERFWLAEADMLGDAGQPEEALKVYEAAFAEMPDSADLLYGRSLIYERQDKIDLSEKDLRAILKQDPDDARAMNALGYMLVVHTKRLKEARELIAKAHELDPDDAAIMDSLGWVQFKLGDAKAARDVLGQALGKLQDPEIAAHLGEVLWSLGEKDQARTVWNKALASDPEHAVLKETVQRLDAPKK